uniref:Uncharacterized protein n=1 Tax=Rhizophora mucronata TaxID=61149 RepID=A0A2P2NT55_RHIMU
MDSDLCITNLVSFQLLGEPANCHVTDTYQHHRYNSGVLIM